MKFSQVMPGDIQNNARLDYSLSVFPSRTLNSALLLFSLNHVAFSLSTSDLPDHPAGLLPFLLKTHFSNEGFGMTSKVHFVPFLHLPCFYCLAQMLFLHLLLDWVPLWGRGLSPHLL